MVLMAEKDITWEEITQELSTEKIKWQVYLDKLEWYSATVLVIVIHTVSLGSTLVPERSAVWYGFEISNYLFCAAICFYHDKRSPFFFYRWKANPPGSFTGNVFWKCLFQWWSIIFYMCVPKRGSSGFAPITGSHVKTYSARCTGGSAAFLADLCNHLVICADTVFPLCNAAYPGFCFKRACGCGISSFQILGTYYWDTLYYNSIVSGSGSLPVFYIGILSDWWEQGRRVLLLWSRNPFCLSGSPSYLQWGTISSLFI